MRTFTAKGSPVGVAVAAACVVLALSLGACGSVSGSGSSSAPGSSTSASAASSSAAESSEAAGGSSSAPVKGGVGTGDAVSSDADGEHAIVADGTDETYSNMAVSKTGDSDSGDEADFYGDNAAVFATNGATLNLSDMAIESDGTHANAVFSYGEGTTVNIVDSVIETVGNCSGGIMTTGGATMNAANLRVTTSGNSSAAIRSDRGGGTVNVEGGVYTTSGTGSPAIYSTADITVSDAELESTASQGVVVEGKNSVTLHDVDLVADNNKKNSDKSDFYQAVMIYQSMSGDAATGKAAFSMDGGSITNKNGDIFFVNNTVATIDLNDVEIVNEDAEGAFLRAAAAGWGSEGSNGGQVTLNATNQDIAGDIVVDGVSNLNLYLQGGSTLTGAVNADGAAGEVYVDVSEGATWKLTGDSYITSLTCDADSVDLNGYTLHVGDGEYVEGTASTGEAIETVVSESAGGPGDGAAPPDGEGSGQGGQGGNPPEKPSGDGGNPPSGNPPEKPSGDSGGASSGSKPPSKPGESGSSSGDR